MVYPEVIRIPNTRDFSEETSFPPKLRFDVDRLRNTSQVRSVEAGDKEGASRKNNDGDDITGIAVVAPVCRYREVI